MNLKNIILEVLDTVVSDYKIKVHPYSRNISIYFNVDKEKYELNFNRGVENENLVTIDFLRWDESDKEYGGYWNMSTPKDKGYNPSKILGSIVNLIKTVIQKFNDIEYITFNTDTTNTSRIRLYDSIVKKSISQGLVNYADKNSEMYKDIKSNYPSSWILKIKR
jgi:DNA-directed RNA polymerase subunit L